eukprot:6175935-Pleurochrysis_carterae.AAC.5
MSVRNVEHSRASAKRDAAERSVESGAEAKGAARRARVSAEDEAGERCQQRTQEQDRGAYDEQQCRVRRHIGVGVALGGREVLRQHSDRTGLARKAKAKVVQGRGPKSMQRC